MASSSSPFPPDFNNYRAEGSDLALIFSEEAEPEQVKTIAAFLQKQGFFVYVHISGGVDDEEAPAEEDEEDASASSSSAEGSAKVPKTSDQIAKEKANADIGLDYIHIGVPLSKLLAHAASLGICKTLKCGGLPVPFEVSIAEDFENFDPENPEMMSREFLTFAEAGIVASDLLWELEADEIAEAVDLEPFENMVTTLLYGGFLQQGPCYLHDLDRSWQLHEDLAGQTPGRWKLQPLREYMGDEYGIYFEFLQFYTTCLWWPSTLGLLLAIAPYLREDVARKVFRYGPPFFSVFIILWSSLFLKFWERRSSRLALLWGTDGLDAVEKVRYNFVGYITEHPVTGKPTKTVKWWSRIPMVFLSVLVTLIGLGMVYGVMILGMNVMGYIKQKSSWAYIGPLAQLAEEGQMFDEKVLWKSLIPTLVHVTIIQIMNLIYRGIAEKMTDWENWQTERAWNTSVVIKRFSFEAVNCYLPLFWVAFMAKDLERLQTEMITLFLGDTVRRVLLELVVPFLLGRTAGALRKSKRRQAAVDEKENEKEQEQLEDGKETAEEGQTAIGDGDAGQGEGEGEGEGGMEKQTEGDEETEALIPSSAAAASSSSSEESKEKGKEEKVYKRYKKKEPPPPVIELTVEEKRRRSLHMNLDFPEIDGGTFDDYMELVIQYGYVTLFAAAFPLGATLAWGANLLEMRQDLFKFMACFQRPRPCRENGIGIYMSMMIVIMLVSVVTNSYLFVYSNKRTEKFVLQFLNAIDEIFHKVFIEDNGNEGSEGFHSMEAAGVAERSKKFDLFDAFNWAKDVMFLVCFLLWNFIPSVSSQVEIERLRREYQAQQRRKLQQDKAADLIDSSQALEEEKRAEALYPSLEDANRTAT